MPIPSTAGEVPRQLNSMNTATIAIEYPFEFLTLSEAAKILRVAPITIRRLIDKRKIRFYKICSHICFKKVDLAEFVEKQATDKIDLSGYENRQA